MKIMKTNKKVFELWRAIESYLLSQECKQSWLCKVFIANHTSSYINPSMGPPPARFIFKPPPLGTPRFAALAATRGGG